MKRVRVIFVRLSGPIHRSASLRVVLISCSRCDHRKEKKKNTVILREEETLAETDRFVVDAFTSAIRAGIHSPPERNLISVEELSNGRYVRLDFSTQRRTERRLFLVRSHASRYSENKLVGRISRRVAVPVLLAASRAALRIVSTLASVPFHPRAPFSHRKDRERKPRRVSRKKSVRGKFVSMEALSSARLAAGLLTNFDTSRAIDRRYMKFLPSSP